MEAVQFHLIFTHAVVATVVIGILLLAWSLFRKSVEVRTAACLLLIAGALLAIPVYVTGEPAEERVEDFGVSHDAIHEHEESAELTFIAIELLGVAAFVTMLLGMRQRRTGVGPSVGLLVFGLIVCAMSIRTATLGGEIRHEEIGSGAADVETHSDEDHDDH